MSKNKNDMDLLAKKLIKLLNSNTPEMELMPFCKEYSEYIRVNRAIKTYGGVELVCQKLLRYFSPVRKLDTIKQKDAEQFLNSLKKTAPKGVYNYYRTVRALFNKAVEWNYLFENPFLKIKLQKMQNLKPTCISETQLWEIVKYIDIQIVADMVITAFYSGCRLGELVNLTWQDVNLRDDLLTIGSKTFQTKARKQRLVPIHSKVKEILIKRFPKVIRNEKHFVFSKKSGCGFTGDFISKRFKKACRKAGMDEDLHFHSIRHGAATRMVNNGAPLPSVQRILGHSNIQTTMIYMNPDLDSLRDAVNRL